MNFLRGMGIKATGVGSMPHEDVRSACKYILDVFPDLPFWPQLSKLSPRENMLIQFSENLPCVSADLARKGVYFDTSRDYNREMLLVYERLTENDVEHFKISREYAAGFYQLLEDARHTQTPFIKGQVVGPITFLAAVPDDEGKALVYDEMLSDAVIKALAMKAVWQARKIRDCGKSAVIFFDEPYLASFGSAFCNLSRERVVSILNDTIQTVKSYADVPVGVHCCGNSDWQMLLDVNMDIINFDFFGFGRYFTLYPESIRKYLDRGGIIAWGAVPTAEYDASLTPDVFVERFKASLDEMENKGIERNLLLKHSMFTPACGMGLLDEKTAETILELTANLSREKF